MIAAISDFFQSTFTGSLTRFIQTNYVVVSAIFLFLNILLIIPDMIAHDVLFSSSLLSLNPVLQGALVGVLVLVLAYLLACMSSSILRFMMGESWSTSFPGHICTKAQQRERENLREQKKSAHEVDALEIENQLLRRFPQDASQIGPVEPH